jgi:DNA-binding IclR family transcriptional regulator
MTAATLNKNHKVYFVPGLQRGLRALEILADAERPLTVSEMARRLDLSRSSAFRLIYTLRHMGFLEDAADARTYQLGARVLNLGFAYLNKQDIIQIARRDLEALRDATGVSAHLAIRDGLDVLFLDCVQTRTGFLSNVNVGARIPVHASPLGWLLLSDLPNREIATLFKDGPLVPLTDQTPTDVAGLMQVVARAAADGIVISRGFVELGGCSIAASVMDKDGKIIAAIDISGPETAFDQAKMESFYADEVRKAARTISARLGYGGSGL